jgi:phosphatidylglycerol:prolipoprotein diacylglycerol transferase
LGCTVAFDHPGVATTFFLGQRYSDHVVRHNLGFYEALCIIPIVVIFQWVARRNAGQPGYLVGLLALCYAPVRFLLDFLRIDDARYFGFTPGQYSAVVLAVAGYFVLRKAKRSDA